MEIAFFPGVLSTVECLQVSGITTLPLTFLAKQMVLQWLAAVFKRAPASRLTDTTIKRKGRGGIKGHRSFQCVGWAQRHSL